MFKCLNCPSCHSFQYKTTLPSSGTRTLLHPDTHPFSSTCTHLFLLSPSYIIQHSTLATCPYIYIMTTPTSTFSLTLSLTLTLVLVLVLPLPRCAHARNPPKPHPYFGAICIRRSNNCNRFYSRWSGHRCVANRAFDQQPPRCYNYVCAWCFQYPKRQYKSPCNGNMIRQVCKSKSDTPPPPQQQQPPSPSPKGTNNNGQCTWTGRDNRVVIDFGKIPVPRGWDRVQRGNARGIIFLRSPSKNISPPGKYGKFCVTVNPPETGRYYFTAISYAPHPTEHNDVWVDSSNGFELWKHGRKHSYVRPGSWTKAYQNNGKKGMSDEWRTIDFNGHRFIIPNVVRGRRMRICLSGRSKRYSIFQIIVAKCWGDNCSGGRMKGLMGLSATKCV